MTNQDYAEKLATFYLTRIGCHHFDDTRTMLADILLDASTRGLAEAYAIAEQQARAEWQEAEARQQARQAEEDAREVAFTGTTLADLWEDVRQGKAVGPLFDNAMDVYRSWHDRHISMSWGHLRDRGVEALPGASYDDLIEALRLKYGQMRGYDELMEEIQAPAWRVLPENTQQLYREARPLEN